MGWRVNREQLDSTWNRIMTTVFGLRKFAVIVVLAFAVLAGCATEKNRVASSTPPSVPKTKTNPPQSAVAAQKPIAKEQNPIKTVSAEEIVEPLPAPLPETPPAENTLIYNDMTLQQAVKTACENSSVIRSLGGRVISAPASVNTSFDPDIRRFHPRYGIEAATSEFDPELRARAAWQRDHLAANNVFTYPNGIVNESVPSIGYELSKYTEYGGKVYFKHETFYDDTNAQNSRFGSYWDTRLGAGLRQPLLRGAGREYNLVFGRSDNQDLLLSNGIMIAQIDASASRFKLESAVMKLLSDVEEAYWRLTMAYHDLAAKVAIRDRAYEDWQRIAELKRQGLKGGEVASEALARANFYAMQQEVQDALYGTQTSTGVLEGSRRLKELLGIPPSPTDVVRPIEIPSDCKFVFDWQWIYDAAVRERPELREQQLMVQRSEMQLSASRNTLLPRLDLIAEYNVQGYGQKLAGQGPEFYSAGQTLGEGYNGGTLGLEAVWKLGERQSRSAVRYANLQVCRQRAILQEQRKQIAHELAAVRQQMERAQMTEETARLRLEATQQNLAALEDGFRTQRVTLESVINARRLYAEAQTAYYRTLVERAIQLKNVQYVKGSLLLYHDIQFSAEGEDATFEVGTHEKTAEQPFDYRMPDIEYQKIDPTRTLPKS